MGRYGGDGANGKGGAENFKTYTPKRLIEVLAIGSKRHDESKTDGQQEKGVPGKKESKSPQPRRR